MLHNIHTSDKNAHCYVATNSLKIEEAVLAVVAIIIIVSASTGHCHTVSDVDSLPTHSLVSSETYITGAS